MVENIAGCTWTLPTIVLMGTPLETDFAHPLVTMLLPGAACSQGPMYDNVVVRLVSVVAGCHFGRLGPSVHHSKED